MLIILGLLLGVPFLLAGAAAASFVHRTWQWLLLAFLPLAAGIAWTDLIAIVAAVFWLIGSLAGLIVASERAERRRIADRREYLASLETPDGPNRRRR
jgi:hypothetical protein